MAESVAALVARLRVESDTFAVAEWTPVRHTDLARLLALVEAADMVTTLLRQAGPFGGHICTSRLRAVYACGPCQWEAARGEALAAWDRAERG